MALIDPCLYLQADAHPARTFRQLITAMLAEGILGSTSMAVTQRASGGPNFSVDIAAGMAVVQGDSATQQGRYLVVNDATVNDASTVVTSAPSAGNTRYDIVVLEVKDNAEDAGGLNLPRFRVIAGTPATSGAVAPAVPATCLLLATIGPIVNSTTTITNSLITDGRVVSRLANDVISPASVTTAKLADEAVTAAKIGTGAVTNTSIGTNAVSETKIGLGAVTDAKVLSSSPTWGFFSFAAGCGSPAGAIDTPRAARFGNMIMFSGACRFTVNQASIGNVAAGWRPPTTVTGIATLRDQTARIITIDTSGNVAVYGGAIGTTTDDVALFAMYRGV